MNQKQAIEIVKMLKEAYPDAKCSLDFKTPFEMLVAVCLSAQCTDERVNKTTPSIFAKYDTPEDFANADIKELEELVHPCGFYKNKAKNLKAAGQKIMLEAFNDPQGIAVDTHCKRIANRLGLSAESEPSKIEKDLCELIPKEYWKDVNHILIWHGRKTCSSQKPKCSECALNKQCKNVKSFKL